MESSREPDRTTWWRAPRLRAAVRVVLLVVAAILFVRALLGKPDRHIASYSRQDYQQAILELARANTPLDRYDALEDAAKTSVYFGTLKDAEQYATELLGLAKTDEGSWNRGNAIHHGHVVLGLVALRRGQLEEAKRELLLAGDTPGSPQLDTFGPNMLLAKELLERGERSTVIEYYERCRRFWEMDRGRLTEWSDDARAGRDSNFGANLVF